MNTLENCGYCGGNGFVWGPMYDSHGYQRHEEPPRVECEYCAGAGVCVDGNKLLPAPTREDILRRSA